MERLIRRKVSFVTVLGVLLLTLAMAPLAGATMVTDFVSFTVPFGSGAVNPVVGSFTITFDPAVSASEASTITLDSLNINLGSSLAFNNTPGSTLIVGGSANGAGTVIGGTDDFFLVILGIATATPSIASMTYSQVGSTTQFHNFFGSGSTITVGAPAVPIPPTVLLFGSGLLGLVGWRIRKS